MCFVNDEYRYNPSPPAKAIYTTELSGIASSVGRPTYADEIANKPGPTLTPDSFPALAFDPHGASPARTPSLYYSDATLSPYSTIAGQTLSPNSANVGRAISPVARKSALTSETPSHPELSSKDASSGPQKPKGEASDGDKLQSSTPNSPPVIQIPLTTSNIRHALAYANTYLKERRQRFVIVAMGEVVKALRLGPHVEAESLNFFGVHLSEVQVKAIANVMEHGEQMTGIPLARSWMDADFIKRLGPRRHRFLTELAMKTPTGVNPPPLLFNGEFLEVRNVPLSYTFMMYISRLDTKTEKLTDFPKAIDFLHAMVVTANGIAVTEQRIATWCEEYGMTIQSRQVLQRVNARYGDLHHRTGIML